MSQAETATYTVTYGCNLGFNTITVEWPHPVRIDETRKFLAVAGSQITGHDLTNIKIVDVHRVPNVDPSLAPVTMTELARES